MLVQTPQSKIFFVKQVNKIRWEYKLSPETINLPKTSSVPEFQILSIELKDTELKHEILHCIDKAIPSPIIFELSFEDKIKVIAAYKRLSEMDSSKWELSNYFETSWIPKDTPRQPLPIVLNIEKLYVYLLNSLIPFPSNPDEELTDRIERTKLIVIKQREVEKCKARLNKEKQFNRKVALNAELRTLKKQLENLTHLLAETTP